MENEYTGTMIVDVVKALSRALAYIRPLALRKKSGHLVDPVDDASERLLEVTKGAHDVLLKINTVFPFTLFPDTVVIDREKITIANRFFFRVAKISSVAIEDILSVEADVGPFFGSVHISSRYFITNPQSIRYLWHGDAIKIQRLLQGYIIAREKHIDCLSIDKQDLMTMLYDLGQGLSD